ncbi:unnamed protein product, partial [Vitis vinifera]
MKRTPFSPLTLLSSSSPNFSTVSKPCSISSRTPKAMAFDPLFAANSPTMKHPELPAQSGMKSRHGSIMKA